MKKFSDMNIPAPPVAMTGEKISINKLLNREIVVESFKIVDSVKKAGTKCLHLQIKLADKHHVLFTGSTALMEQIKQVQRDSFPFTATIIEENKTFQFN